MKLSMNEKIGYGMGNFANRLVFETIMTYLMFFYTDIYGIPATVVGTLFLISRFWDAINDPIMGAIADRTKSRWGKFRPYLLWMAIPFAIMTFLTFTTPNFGMTGKIIYAWITYILLMMVYTSVDVPYSALSGVMTDDSLERTGLNVYRMGLAQVGSLLVGIGILPLVHFFGRGDQAKGYQLTMLCFGIFAAIIYIYCFSSTRERISPPPEQKASLKADIKMLAKNRPWQIMFVCLCLMFIFLTIRSSMVLYYFNYHVGSDKLVPLFLLFTSIAGIIGIILAKPVAQKIGKKKTWVLGNLISTISIFYFFLPPEATLRIFFVNIIWAMSGMMTSPLVFAIIADTADYAEWKFGIRSTGIVFSASTFANKFGMGIGGALAAFLLSFCGYVPGAEQTDLTVTAIRFMFGVIPAIIAALLAGMMFFYKIDDQLCKKMQIELAERRLGTAQQNN